MTRYGNACGPNSEVRPLFLIVKTTPSKHQMLRFKIQMGSLSLNSSIKSENLLKILSFLFSGQDAKMTAVLATSSLPQRRQTIKMENFSVMYLLTKRRSKTVPSLYLRGSHKAFQQGVSTSVRKQKLLQEVYQFHF